MDATRSNGRQSKHRSSDMSDGAVEMRGSNGAFSKCEIKFQRFREHSPFDIIFVHGMTKTAEHTWCGQEKENFWLKKLLPQDVNVSIITCGLDLLKASSDSVSFTEISYQLFVKLEEKRKEMYNLKSHDERPAIFVCHSLGGMLMRRALMPQNPSEVEKNDFGFHLRRKTKGLMFFGTPNYVTNEEWAHCIGLIERERKKKIDANVNDRLSQDFAKLNDSFLKYVYSRKEPYQDICCFYETEAAYEVGLVAPENCVSIQNYPSLPQQASHMTLARYENANEPAYQIFVERLYKLQAIQAIPSTSQYKWQESQKSPLHKVSNLPGSRTCDPLAQDNLETPDGREIIVGSKSDPNDDRMIAARQRCLLALAHEDMGRLEIAHDLYQQAYEAYCSIAEIGKHHALSLFCRDKQGSIKRDQGDYGLAEQIGREVYEAQLEADREHLLRGAGNLARTLRFRGKYHEAFHTIKGALMEVDGCPLHSVSGTTAVSILAKILKDLGKYKFAEHLSRDVVRACYVLLGDDHSFTLNRESDLAVVIAKRGRYETAVNVSGKALRGLERTLPVDHPLTLRTAKRHATYLRFCGDFEKAEDILKRTLESQQAKLGVNHPDVLSTRSSLAALDILSGRAKEALEKYENVLKCREENFNELQAEYKSGRASKPDAVQPDLTWTRQAVRLTKDILKAESNATTPYSLSEQERIFFRTPTLNENAQVGEGDYDDLEKYPIPRSQKENDLLAILEHPEKNHDLVLLGKALRIAASEGDMDAVRSALKMGDVINYTGGYYGNALQAACYFGKTELVRFLIENGAKSDEHRVGLFGFALRAAALGNHAKVASILLGAGGEQNAKALADATDKILGTSLEAAMAGFYHSVTQVLLDHGANPDAEDPSLGTPLQQAAWAGNVELVAMLLKKGANPTLKSGAIDSALRLAASENKEEHRKIMWLLLKHGAASNSETYSEALDAAVRLGYTENVEILAKYWPYKSFDPPEVHLRESSQQFDLQEGRKSRPLSTSDYFDFDNVQPAHRPDLDIGSRDPSSNRRNKSYSSLPTRDKIK